VKPITRLLLTYTPIGLVLILDAWAFSTGTYASDRDRILPYWFAICAFLYMAPAIIACHRNHSRFFAIWLIDLVFTPLFLVGWIGALIWAFIDPKRTSPEQMKCVS
jgi:Superinfection immunity protein